MRQKSGMGGDMACVKGRHLGATAVFSRGNEIDAPTTALIALAAHAFPPINGGIMASLERHFRIEPQQKPALRRLIADNFQNPPSLSATVRSFKRQTSPRHADNYRLVTGLCQVARAADLYDGRTLGGIITAAKALGISRNEMLTLFQKTGLAA